MRGILVHTIFEHLIKVFQMHDYHITMFLENSQCDENVKITTQPVRPQGLPESKYVRPFELALVPYEQHTEEKEEISRVGGLEMQV